MVYKKEAWIACLKKAIADLKMEDAPTSGKVCAIASLRYVRDAVIDDIYGAKPASEDEGAVDAIRESFRELIKAVNAEGADSGFASNASAAAKAAGFKSTSATVVEIAD